MRLTRLLALAATLGIWTVSHAEPLVSINNVNPLTSDVGYGVFIYPLDGNLNPVNQIDALRAPVDFVAGQGSIQVQIPASPTPYKFVGVRVWYRIAKGTGVTPVYWGTFDHSQAAKAVPAGTPVNCTYTAPVLATGDLTCALVVVAPPPPPPPPPPPAPACVRIPPVSPATGEVTDFTAKIVDGSGATWTIAPRVQPGDTVPGQVTLKRNGSTMFGGVEYAYRKDADPKTPVCVADFKSGPGRSCFNGSGWTAASGAATIGTAACP